jgi:hypothetical protein
VSSTSVDLLHEGSTTTTTTTANTITISTTSAATTTGLQVRTLHALSWSLRGTRTSWTHEILGYFCLTHRAVTASHSIVSCQHHMEQ